MNFNVSLWQGALDALSDGVYIVDTERRIVYWNAAAERIAGYSSAEMLGSHCHDNRLMHVNDAGVQLCKGFCPLAATLCDGAPREDEVYLHHRDGHRLPIHVKVSPIRDEAGAIVGATEVFSDHTPYALLSRENAKLKELALLDPLTELGNRRHAEDQLTSMLSESARYGWTFGAVFVDIDSFKQINDRLGHEIGDRSLRVTARALRGGIRSYDRVFRWGGDEFLALIKHVDIHMLRAVAEKLRVLVECCTVPTGGEPIRLTVSIGATALRPGEGRSNLLDRADRLMYDAKAQGRNRIALG
jgi:diguanylate cyclase (GGDEF)-like protein/PAS domain S-box-containing protein